MIISAGSEEIPQVCYTGHVAKGNALSDNIGWFRRNSQVCYTGHVAKGNMQPGLRLHHYKINLHELEVETYDCKFIFIN